MRDALIEFVQNDHTAGETIGFSRLKNVLSMLPINRRKFVQQETGMAGGATCLAASLLPEAAEAAGIRRIITILHTNDVHSASGSFSYGW